MSFKIGEMTWKIFVLGSVCQLEPSTYYFANWILELDKIQYFRFTSLLIKFMWHQDGWIGQSVWLHTFRSSEYHIYIKKILDFFCKNKLKKKLLIPPPLFSFFCTLIVLVLYLPSHSLLLLIFFLELQSLYHSNTLPSPSLK